MSRIITLFNQSGGVSKTTLTHNLGYHLAANKRRVLLVDMDPQASLT
ncbi:MAG: ParA family protein, partial [Cyanobacteria bacterium J06632_19]